MINKINISSDKQKLIVYIVLTVVTLAVFWQVNQYGFISDDFVYVTENSQTQSGITLDGLRWAIGTKYLGLWNPLVWLSLMFDYQIYGLNAGGYHLTNLILHIMSTLLLFWLFNRMTGTIWKSAFVAAIFALHPLHVESVAWIAERKDVLSAFFWMLTLCLYVYYTEKPAINRYLPVLLCFVCALMSKPMVITLPIVMILLDYWPLDRLQSLKIIINMPEVLPVSTKKGKKKNELNKEDLKKNIPAPNSRKSSKTKIAGIIPIWQLKEKIPFFVLSIIMVIITLYNPNTPDMSDSSGFKQIPLISRLANAPVAFVTYLVKTLWPQNMAAFYPFPDQIPLWQVMGASLLIFVFSIAVIVMIKRLPYLFAGWMWFSITIAPVIGILQVSITAPCSMADRYHYLPSIGLAAMLAWGIPALVKSEAIRKKVLFPAAIAFLIIMTFITWKQCGYWKNSTTLFNHALQVTKDNYVAHHYLGFDLFEKGKIEEASDHYNKAILIAPDYVFTYVNRGVIYGVRGQYQLAIEDFNHAIRILPSYGDAYYNRGLAYAKLGQYQHALEDYNKAIRFRQNYALPYLNRGVIYGERGQYQLAIEDFNTTIRLKKDYAPAYNNRGYFYLKQGDKNLGCRDAQKACELGNCKLLKDANTSGLCR